MTLCVWQNQRQLTRGSQVARGMEGRALHAFVTNAGVLADIILVDQNYP